ncbi:hypothetical protein VTJ49DRAFT_443 [Mycothermus thermophilus]|uniref:Uncharacterized protein n=1 Tax=Humicola insolens TaxID=85995 RepID=A0ABR3VGD1_HUMIN
MRAPSSDAREEGERGVCVSRDGQGRILKTTFPVFSHPFPVRPVPFVYDRHDLFDSENTGTAMAQVGLVVSPVPPSQKGQNLRWHKWLEQPSSPLASLVAVEGSRISLDHRASPGISEVCPPRQDPSALLQNSNAPMSSEPNLLGGPDTQEESKLPSSECSQLLYQYEDLLARLRRLDQFDDPPPCEEQHGEPIEEMAKDTIDITPDTIGEEAPLVSHSEEYTGVEATVGNNLEQDSPDSHGDAPPPTNAPHHISPSPCPLVLQQTQSTSNETDPEEAWKKFVFGAEPSDEVRKEVFEEAKQEVAWSLQPPPQLVNSAETSESDATNAATVGMTYAHRTRETSEDILDSPSVGSLEANESACVSTSDQTESRPDLKGNSTDAPSTEANAGSGVPSRAGKDFETSESIEESPSAESLVSSVSAVCIPAPDQMDPRTELDEDSTDAPSTPANAGSGGSSGTGQDFDVSEVPAPQGVDDVTSDLHTGPPTTTLSMAVVPAQSEIALREDLTSDSQTGPLSTGTSMAVVPAESEVGPAEKGTVKEPFRFAQPKLFVGSRSNQAQPPRVQDPTVGITLTKRRRGRGKKRANDGRADIRALPNYSSDPIEEFEEEKRVRKRKGKRATNPLFPALELT